MNHEPIHRTLRALLLIAHGSRRESSNDEIAELASALAARNPGGFDVVRHAFLEMASPSIDEGIDALVADGASEIVVLPYFLAAGNHVLRDIPAIVEQCRGRHGGVEITQRAYLGTHHAVVDLLADLARGASA